MPFEWRHMLTGRSRWMRETNTLFRESSQVGGGGEHLMSFKFKEIKKVFFFDTVFRKSKISHQSILHCCIFCFVPGFGSAQFLLKGCAFATCLLATEQNVCSWMHIAVECYLHNQRLWYFNFIFCLMDRHQ